MWKKEIGWKENKESGVFEMVRNFKGDKALGPDGFSMPFFPEVLGCIKRE
jgi:hypothetical protein